MNWAPIKGYEGIYEVSDTGQVRSLDRKVSNGKGFRLAVGQDRVQRINKRTGYYTVGLCKRGKMKNETVHRLIAKSFLKKPRGKNEVNHIDGNKLNNALENLEWVNRSENIKHAYQNGLIKTTSGEEKINAKLSNRDVIYIRANYKPVGLKALIEQFNVTEVTIRRVVKGQSYKKVSGGYRI